MRITDNILNKTSLESGLPLTGGNSLVNQLNGNASGSIVDALGNSSGSAAGKLSKSKYQKIREAAEKLEKQVNLLKESGEDSVFEKARKSGDMSEVCAEIEKFAAAYNDMMDKLRTDTGAMNSFYRSSMQEAVKESKEALSNIGITVDKNGKLYVDKEKLKGADLDKLESLFGGGGTVMTKLSLIAGKIVDNADANIKSASSQYNAAGNSVDALLQSFDAKG